MQRVTVSFTVDVPNSASVLASAEAMRLGAMQELRRTLLYDDGVGGSAPAVVVHANSCDCYRGDEDDLGLRRR